MGFGGPWFKLKGEKPKKMYLLPTLLKLNIKGYPTARIPFLIVFFKF